MFYFRCRKLEEAKSALLAASRGSKDSAQADLLLGMIFERQKDFEAAKSCYRKALDKKPDMVAAANNLAFLYAEHGGNMDEALNLILRVGGPSPANPSVSDTVGWIYLKKNMPTQALQYLKTAAAESPGNASIRYHLGLAYRQTGNMNAAKKEFRKALEIDPGLPEAPRIKEMISEK
jgi:Tfp pilus assembly protein PilF